MLSGKIGFRAGFSTEIFDKHLPAGSSRHSGTKRLLPGFLSRQAKAWQ